MNDYITIVEFFTNPIFSASMISSMLMCFGSSLISVIVFVKRRSLVGEALSHAAYPGIAISVLVCAPLFTSKPFLFPFVVLIGAFISAIIGMKLITFMERRLHVKSDSALSFVLSTFLGVGILIASRIQFTHPIWFGQVQMFLYGQSATMMSSHVVLYFILSSIIVFFVVFLFHTIKLISFDEVYSKVLGMKVKFVESIILILIVLAVVIGIRTVGVVLMAGMLIAPAATARMLSNKLSTMFCLSSIFGVLSGFLGNYLSVNLSIYIMNRHAGWKISLPTGPMIVIVSVMFSILAMIFAKERGFLVRFYRMEKFRLKVVFENFLKDFYKINGGQSIKGIKINSICIIFILHKFGFLYKKNKLYFLTEKGKSKARRVIRLHRVWELYLFECLQISADNVHCSAEEIEHIITRDMENELSKILNDPKVDPHNQEIPVGDL